MPSVQCRGLVSCVMKLYAMVLSLSFSVLNLRQALAVRKNRSMSHAMKFLFLFSLITLLFYSCGDGEHDRPVQALKMGASRTAEDSSASVIHALHTLHSRSQGNLKSSNSEQVPSSSPDRSSAENVRLGVKALTYSNYDLTIFGRAWRTLFAGGHYSDAREVFKVMDRACLRDTSSAYTKLMLDYADAVTWYGTSWALDPNFYDPSFTGASKLFWNCDEAVQAMCAEEASIDSAFIAELTYNTAVTELIRTSGRSGFTHDVAHGHVNVRDVSDLAGYISVRQALDTSGNLNALFKSLESLLLDHHVELADFGSSELDEPMVVLGLDTLGFSDDSLCSEVEYDIKYNTDCLRTLIDTVGQMQEVVILLDHSGSMMNEAVVRIDGKRVKANSRYALVQDHSQAIISALNPGVRLGLISVGNELEDWPDVFYYPADSLNGLQDGLKNQMMGDIKGLPCFGATPLVRQIERALPMFSNDDNQKMLVILSDGADSYNYNFQLNSISNRLKRADIFPYIVSYLEDNKENQVNYACFNELIAHGGSVIKMVGDCSDLSKPIDSWVPVFVPSPELMKYDCGEYNPSGYILAFPGFESDEIIP